MDKFGNIDPRYTPDIRDEHDKTADERERTAAELERSLLLDMAAKVESRGKTPDSTGNRK
jgi:hypothetical protein